MVKKKSSLNAKLKKDGKKAEQKLQHIFNIKKINKTKFSSSKRQHTRNSVIKCNKQNKRNNISSNSIIIIITMLDCLE